MVIWRIVFWLLVSVCAVSAQEAAKPAATQLVKFDEFGDVSAREYGPKINHFVEALRKSDSATGYVVFYNCFNESAFKRTKFYAQRKTETYTRFFSDRYDPPRVTFILGGLREKMTVELWIVPLAGPEPGARNAVGYDEGEREKLETLGAGYLDLEEAKTKIEPPGENYIGNARRQTKPEAKDFAAEIDEVLGRDPAWRAVVIFYANKDEYDIDRSRRLIENRLAKTAGLDRERVKLVYGGFRTVPALESWIVNAGGIEPEPVPEEKID
jgi:hypothetical protein